MRGILRFGAMCALSVGAACGGGNGTPDAALTPDGPPDDPLDGPPDGPPMPIAVHRWVVDNQLIPQSNPQAVQLGLDLDSDGIVDNQFGFVLASLNAQGSTSRATPTARSRAARS